MAVTDAYETAVNYRGVTGKTDTGSDDAILVDLTAISRYLEGRLGRFFTVDAAAVARVYLPPVNGLTLRVDDMSAAPTSIKFDTAGDGTFATAVALATTDYELLPLNAALGPEPRPYTQIRIPPWSTQGGFYTTQRVQVTAKFGWPAIPVAVKRATIHLTAILRLESPRATNQVTSIDQVVETSPIAQSIIRQLTDAYKIERYV